MRQLTTSLSSLKESQAESFSVLPRPNPFKEPKRFSECDTVADVLGVLGEKDPDYSKIPPITLLRCGIEDFGKGKESTDSKPTTEDLFRYLEGQLPWLLTEEGYQFEVCGKVQTRFYSNARMYSKSYGILCQQAPCSARLSRHPLRRAWPMKRWKPPNGNTLRRLPLLHPLSLSHWTICLMRYRKTGRTTRVHSSTRYNRFRISRGTSAPRSTCRIGRHQLGWALRVGMLKARLRKTSEGKLEP